MKLKNKLKGNQSISSKMMSANIIVMIIMILVFGIISYLIAKINTESDSYNDMCNAGNVISGIASDYMSSKIASVSSVAANSDISDFINSCGSASTLDELKNSEYFSDTVATLDLLTASDRGIISAWLVSENSGTLIANDSKFISSDEFSLDTRYWYRDYSSISNKSVICSAETPSLFDDSVNVVTIIAPIYSNSSIVGYLGAEVNTNELNRILSQYTLNSGCYPVIACNYGTLIYSPSTAEFKDKFSVNQSPLNNILVQAHTYSDGIDNYSVGINDTKYFYIDNTSIPCWSIVVLFDNTALNGGIYKFFIQEMIILICVITLYFIIMRNKVKAENELVPRINEAVKQLAGGNYKYTVDTAYEGNNELMETARNLNTIAALLNEKNQLLVQYTSNDTLTGLPNRISLYNKIEELINSNKDNDGNPNRFALMFVDVDNFKWLNETLGHNFGDAVLCTFAEVLSTALSKYGTVYRFSGDEFIIIVEFGNDYNKIHDVIESLQLAFEKPIRVMTDNIYLRFSMGVSIYPDDDETADMLLRDADMALHKAKDNGKDRVSFYTNAIQKHSFSKAAISQRISTALKENEMYLNYQPIISTESGDIHGFEVLLRWNSMEFGNIPPTEFIDVAEESGAIVLIGTWIFESACRFLKELCDKYRNDIIISINVSPIQLRRPDYLEHVQRVLEITQVNPANIQIEITESTLIDFLDTNNSVIEQINNMGIAIALDDFGTGYSSLNYLKNFPIKCLKIDKSFVDEINNNKRDYAITDSIIDLVHNLGIKTVAEGIETVGQYNFLKEMKCDYIQGFLMSKPLDEADAIEFVKMYDALHKPDSSILAEHEKQLADEREKREKIQATNDDNNHHDDNNLIDSTISK